MTLVHGDTHSAFRGSTVRRADVGANPIAIAGRVRPLVSSFPNPASKFRFPASAVTRL